MALEAVPGIRPLPFLALEQVHAGCRRGRWKDWRAALAWTAEGGYPYMLFF
jgi:hypothetical protein